MTNRQLISEIRNDMQSISIDQWIPGAYIYAKAVGIASLFLKREADDRRLFRLTDLFTAIKCLEMEEEDLVKCCDIQIPGCTKVMRSKHKLPALYTTRHAYMVNVSSIDYEQDYKLTTPQQYKYIKSRRYQDRRQRYFWIENDHLIIPNIIVKTVTLRGLFINRAEALRLDCNNEGKCIRFLDQQFIAPEHLLKDIKTAVVIDLLSSFKKIEPDNLPNLNSVEKTNPKDI